MSAIFVRVDGKEERSGARPRYRRCTVSVLVALLLIVGSIDFERGGPAIDIAAAAAAAEPASGHRLLIRLTTRGVAASQQLLAAPPAAPRPSTEELALVAERTVATPPQRQRGREIGRDQLAVIALSSDGREIWRTLLPDPRLLRAEVTDDAGKFVASRLFYRKMVEFSVVVPEDPEIAEIVVLETQWTGAAFDLRRLGRIGRAQWGAGPAE